MTLSAPKSNQEEQEQVDIIEVHKKVQAYIQQQTRGWPDGHLKKLKLIWEGFCKMQNDVFFHEAPGKILHQYPTLEKYLERAARRAKDRYGNAGMQLISFLNETWDVTLDPEEKSHHQLELEKWTGIVHSDIQDMIKRGKLHEDDYEFEKVWEELKGVSIDQIREKAKEIRERFNQKAKKSA